MSITFKTCRGPRPFLYIGIAHRMPYGDSIYLYQGYVHATYVSHGQGPSPSIKDRIHVVTGVWHRLIDSDTALSSQAH